MTVRNEATAIVFRGTCFLPTSYWEAKLRVLDAPYELLSPEDATAVEQLAERLRAAPLRRPRSRGLGRKLSAAAPPFCASDQEYRKSARHIAVVWYEDTCFRVYISPQNPPYVETLLSVGKAPTVEDVALAAVRAIRKEVLRPK